MLYKGRVDELYKRTNRDFALLSLLPDKSASRILTGYFLVALTLVSFLTFLTPVFLDALSLNF